jgi:hypothetical protein
MFEKSDQDFLRVLDSQEEFEKRLKLLFLDRKIRVISTACGFFVSIVGIIISGRLTQGEYSEVTIYIMLPSVMLVVFPFTFFIQACHTNSQIKTLLVFQKLNGLHFKK